MKFSTVAVIAATAAVASAQGIADIPACAQTCLLPALQATGCDLTDFKCSCSNDKFVSDSTDCIEKACSAADVAKAAKATYELCQSAGVTIPTRPPVVSSAPATSAAASSSAAAPSSSAAPSTVEEVTSAPPSYESSSAAAPSSYAPVPTTVATTTAAGNATQPTSTPPAYTGGAVALTGSVALAVGGAFAAFFL